MKVQELAALIAVREFAVKNFDNVYFKMSNDDVKALRTKLSLLDKQILTNLLKLDLNDVVESKNLIKNENTK